MSCSNAMACRTARGAGWALWFACRPCYRQRHRQPFPVIADRASASTSGREHQSCAASNRLKGAMPISRPRDARQNHCSLIEKCRYIMSKYYDLNASAAAMSCPGGSRGPEGTHSFRIMDPGFRRGTDRAYLDATTRFTCARQASVSRCTSAFSHATISGVGPISGSSNAKSR